LLFLLYSDGQRKCPLCRFNTADFGDVLITGAQKTPTSDANQERAKTVPALATLKPLRFQLLSSPLRTNTQL